MSYTAVVYTGAAVLSVFRLWHICTVEWKPVQQRVWIFTVTLIMWLVSIAVLICNNYPMNSLAQNKHHKYINIWFEGKKSLNLTWSKAFTSRFSQSLTPILSLLQTYVCWVQLVWLGRHLFKLPAKFIPHVLSSNFKQGAKYTDSFQAKSRDSCVIVCLRAESTPGEGGVELSRQKSC